jgi:hypothetical protein
MPLGVRGPRQGISHHAARPSDHSHDHVFIDRKPMICRKLVLNNNYGSFALSPDQIGIRWICAVVEHYRVFDCRKVWRRTLNENIDSAT